MTDPPAVTTSLRFALPLSSPLGQNAAIVIFDNSRQARSSPSSFSNRRSVIGTLANWVRIRPAARETLEKTL